MTSCAYRSESTPHPLPHPQHAAHTANQFCESAVGTRTSTRFQHTFNFRSFQRGKNDLVTAIERQMLLFDFRPVQPSNNRTDPFSGQTSLKATEPGFVPCLIVVS